MYKGFKVSNVHYDKYYEIGLSSQIGHKTDVALELHRFIQNDGFLNGEKMKEDWFPDIDSDIFISHSHKDEHQAICLAGWLKETFNLDCFIDSCVWGNSTTLLKGLDDIYCFNESSQTYNYTKRNYSTSHVHMMLSVALNKMIDKTECLFFLNTPQSIRTSEIETETLSPWIYSELAFSEVVRKKSLNEHRNIKKLFESRERDLQVSYLLNTNHLNPIGLIDLKQWENEYNTSTSYIQYPLDILYKIMNIQHD